MITISDPGGYMKLQIEWEDKVLRDNIKIWIRGPLGGYAGYIRVNEEQLNHALLLLRKENDRTRSE